MRLKISVIMVVLLSLVGCQDLEALLDNKNQDSGNQVEVVNLDPETYVVVDGDAYYKSSYVYKETQTGPLSLDLVLPNQGQEGLLPVLVYVHGGDFTDGDKAEAYGRDFIGLINGYFLNHGYAVVAVNYRLADQEAQTSIYHAIEDVKTSIDWLRSQSSDLGLDPDRIGVMGNGAGGALASFIAYTEPEEFILGDVVGGQSKPVNFVINLYGSDTRLYDMDDELKGKLNENDSEALAALTDIAFKVGVYDPMDGQGLLRAFEDLNVINYLDDQEIASFIMHGTQDDRVDVLQSKVLADQLEVLGLVYTYEEVDSDLDQLGYKEKKAYIEALFEFANQNN